MQEEKNQVGKNSLYSSFSLAKNAKNIFSIIPGKGMKKGHPGSHQLNTKQCTFEKIFAYAISRSGIIDMDRRTDPGKTGW